MFITRKKLSPERHEAELSPFLSACKNGDYDKVFEMISTYGDNASFINQTDSNNLSGLFHAVSSDNVGMLNIYLSNNII